MKTAFDSNILIYLLDHDVVFGPMARDILSASIETGEAIFSTLAIAEYLSDSDSNETSLRELLALTDCVPVSEDVAIKAAEIRRSHKTIRLPDVLHLATALVSGAGTFVTNDRQLLKLQCLEDLEIKSLS